MSHLAEHKETARAKVNLALQITGRRGDGYHLLDSLVVFADIGDQLSFCKADETSLQISGPFGVGLGGDDDNLIIKAAHAMQAQWPGKFIPAQIKLDKRLPVASGIGGGSADCAATLRGLCALSGFTPPGDELAALALTLGADVPVCLMSKSCRMSGIGEQLSPIANWPQLAAVLVNPGVAVATPQVFQKLGLEPGQQAGTALPACDHITDENSAIDYLHQTRNDMEEYAVRLAPEIGVVLSKLAFEGAKIARMSGSGATCFGLFDDLASAQAAADKLAATHPEWWVKATWFSNQPD